MLDFTSGEQVYFLSIGSFFANNHANAIHDFAKLGAVLDKDIIAQIMRVVDKYKKGKLGGDSPSKQDQEFRNQLRTLMSVDEVKISDKQFDTAWNSMLAFNSGFNKAKTIASIECIKRLYPNVVFYSNTNRIHMLFLEKILGQEILSAKKFFGQKLFLSYEHGCLETDLFDKMSAELKVDLQSVTIITGSPVTTPGTEDKVKRALFAAWLLAHGSSVKYLNDNLQLVDVEGLIPQVTQDAQVTDSTDWVPQSRAFMSFGSGAFTRSVATEQELGSDTLDTSSQLSTQSPSQSSPRPTQRS